MTESIRKSMLIRANTKLHAELFKLAEEQKVSLNTLCVRALQEAVDRATPIAAIHYQKGESTEP